MGDVGTHKAIFEAGVRPALEAVRQDEDYLYVRFGNYLTDLSQVRDTLAYAMAKMRVWQTAQSTSLLLRIPILGRILLIIAGIPDYIEELLGKTTHVEDAALARYLEGLVRCFTILEFVKEQHLPEQEVLRVYARNFTRYYPHEHLDFPPWPYKDPVGDREVDYSVGLLRSLTYQIRYLFESLTAVESAWKSTLDQDRGSQARHDALADLGHTIHAIEDFYFHTNFLEISQLLRLRAGFTEPDPIHTKGFWYWFKEHALQTFPPEENSVRSRRRFYRRLQRPIPGDEPLTLSTRSSSEAISHVSSGGFGSTDIFHTLYGALAGLSAQVTPEQLDLLSARLKIVILKEVLIEEERVKLQDDDYFDAQLKAHKEQLEDPDLDNKVDSAFAAIHWPASAATELKKAIALDRDLTKKYPKGYGIGGFLLSIAKLLQHEHDDSEAASAFLDGFGVVFSGCSECWEDVPVKGKVRMSGETIGTHSLLSKDTKTSFPFRQQAVGFATFVSAFIARTMAERMAAPVGDLDWRPIVQHFIRYPDVNPNSWNSQLAAAIAAGQTLGYAELRDRPDIKAFTRDSKIPILFRMQLSKRDLAGKYDAEAEAATKEWQAR